MEDEKKFLLEDILIGDPVTKRGKSALNRIEEKTNTLKMTEDIFYDDGIYVEPFFVNVLKDPTYDFYAEKNYYDDFAFSELGTNIRNLSDKRVLFEDRFHSGNSTELLMIRAAAGSGKSIYLNYLKHQRRKRLNNDKNDNSRKRQNLIESSIHRIIGAAIDRIDSVTSNHSRYLSSKSDSNELYEQLALKLDNGILNKYSEAFFDMESSESSLQYGNTLFPSNSFPVKDTGEDIVSAPWNFFIMLLDSAYRNCISFILKVDAKKATRIKENFDRFYGTDYQEGLRSFYIELSKMRLMKDSQSLLNQKTDLFEKIIKFCYIDRADAYDNIINVLRFLTRLFAITTYGVNTNQILIAFDNVEHFIKDEKRIFDKDIRTIAAAVLKFTEDEKVYYQKRGLSFPQLFKIILVVRDTTDKMMSVDVHNKFSRMESIIDITGWYPTEEIYEKKLNYYSFYENDPSPEISFFKLIIKDSLKSTKNNLMELISSLYNHNHRRTTRILSRISGTVHYLEEYSANNKNCLTYQQYEALWTSKENNHIKFLCRQSVLRLIFNEISTTGYFDRIFCGNKKNYYNSGTYARRLLIWLANQNTEEDEKYYSFYDIIKNVFCSPNVNEGSLNYNELVEFCNVLLALNEHVFAYPNAIYKSNKGKGPNAWCQLIVIKFNENQEEYNNLSAEILADEMNRQYEAKQRLVDEYGIKLKSAGYYFAKLMRNYEFFACLYDDNEVPLIFLKNKDVIKKNIEIIYQYAKKTIDDTLFFESALFNDKFNMLYSNNHCLLHVSRNQNKEYQSFPFRIIDQHKAYLDAFRLYLSDGTLHNKMRVFEEGDRKELIEYVNQYILLYEEILQAIKDSTYTAKYKNGDKTVEKIIKQYVLTQSVK